MTTPKNEEDIMKDFDNMTAHDVWAIKPFLRSSLASFAMHLKGEMPEKDARRKGLNPVTRVLVEVHNETIDEVHAILDEKIRKLTV